MRVLLIGKKGGSNSFMGSATTVIGGSCVCALDWGRGRRGTPRKARKQSAVAGGAAARGSSRRRRRRSGSGCGSR